VVVQLLDVVGQRRAACTPSVMCVSLSLLCCVVSFQGGDTPLTLATEHKYMDIMEELLAGGASVDYPRAVRACAVFPYAYSLVVHVVTVCDCAAVCQCPGRVDTTAHCMQSEEEQECCEGVAGWWRRCECTKRRGRHDTPASCVLLGCPRRDSMLAGCSCECERRGSGEWAGVF
jgi:hypothetical protein